ncbi:MAG: hypothetical protein J5814_04670 [Bacteroidaceae bacterium]|nr:hypothetical protein [Bacteroidaceae bacterium]
MARQPTSELNANTASEGSSSAEKTFRRQIAIRQQDGRESSQREDARLLVWQHQARLGDDRQGAVRESEGLKNRAADCKEKLRDF